MYFVEAALTWRMLVVLMVWNNVRNASHGETARCIIQHSFEAHHFFSYFFSITISLCFPLSTPTHFCLCSVSALRLSALCQNYQLSHSHTVSTVSFFFLNTKTQSLHAVIHQLAYLLNWLNLNAKPICLPILTAEQFNVLFQ